jgi:signal peptidase
MFKKILTVVSNIALVIILLIGVLVLVSMLPFKNNFQVLSVMSGSMAPKIKMGSLIVIKPAKEYKVNDIITFKFANSKNSKGEQENVTHRIIAIDEKNGVKFYTTKGDANNNPDTGRVAESDVVGKYIFRLPYLGYLIGYIKTLPGLILIIVIPATIIIYEESKNIKKAILEMREKRKKEKNIDIKVKKKGGKSDKNS